MSKFLGPMLAGFLATAQASSAWSATVMVFGASGQLGSEVVRELTAAGHSVTAFVRPSSDLARIKAYNSAIAAGDVLKATDVDAAIKAARPDVVVDALARGDSDPSFYEVSQRFISASVKSNGVKHVILHSSVGAGDSRAIYPKSRWEAMKPTLTAKEAGENHVMASGATYTIIRNAVLRNLAPGAADKAELTEDQAKFGAVTRTGLARLTRECISNAACSNKIFHAIDASVAVPEAAR
jgi:uncharacterized protein YbjT (DUF2867 family)